MLSNYFKIAWRNLFRHKAATAINITGLALGISACLIIYLMVSFELSYEHDIPGRKSIYRVVWGDKGSIPDPASFALRNEVTGLETLACFHRYNAKVAIPGNKGAMTRFDYPQWGKEQSDIIIAEPQYFTVFRYQWLTGDPATALKAPFSLVITESKAHKYFGSIPLEEIVGRTVIYNDSLTLTVTGVVKDLARNTILSFRDFISFSTVNHSFLQKEFNFSRWDEANTTQTFVKLAEGTAADQVNKQLARFARHQLPEKAWADKALRLQPLTGIHFDTAYEDIFSRKAHLPTLYTLMSIAAFILLIAVINFINLSTAQSVERARETGIRKVLGSNRSSLVVQFLSETFILTLLAVVVSLLCLQPLLTAFRSLMPDGVGARLFQPATFVFLLLITVVTALLSGLYPAAVLSGYSPALSLKGNTGPRGNSQAYLRKGLVVFQFTVSLVFIIAALVIGRQVHFMLNKDMGFSKDAIITVDKKDAAAHNRHLALAERIRQLPEVEKVSLSDGTPAAVAHFHLPLSHKGAHVDCQPQWVDTAYLSLYKLKLKAGRNLLASDTARELLINETAAKALGFASPEAAIGQLVETLKVDSTGVHPVVYPVVGVLADFHVESLHKPITPTFFSTNKEFSWSINIRLRNLQPGGIKAALAKIERLWTSVYPNEVFHYDFFDATVASFYEQEQRTAKLINIAMMIAISISCMGLFGLAAFTARQRMKEIGIRKVLGASVTSIVIMLNKDFILLILIALLTASPIAWYLMRGWLENFAYTVNISWDTFLMAGVIAAVIALATVSHLAVRAAFSNPVKSLRSE
jgi:ABC-type antimicrobial peptide transport system permease subunit